MWDVRRWLKRTSGLEAGGALAWLIALVALGFRLPYGVNHTDEAFYSAMPYSFLLGNRPYVDELAMHQNAALLLLPFYRLYLAAAGSASGIILFNRYLYLGYATLCSVLAVLMAKRVGPRSVAYWAGALVVSFSYYNLFALSYNTFGAFGFFCGLCLGAKSLLAPRPGLGLFGAGLFLLSAVFAYPALAAVALPYGLLALGWLYWKAPRSALYSGARGLVGVLVVGLATLVPWALWIGPSGFSRLLEFSRSMGYGTRSAFSKLNFFASDAWRWWHWRLLGFAVVLVLTPLLCRSLKRGLWLVALVSSVALGLCYRAGLSLPSTDAPTPATVFLSCSLLLAPVCVALNRDWQYGRFVMLLLWLPSAASMLVITYASANGYHAASLGALGVLLAGALSLGAQLHALAEREPESRSGYELVLGAVLASIFFIQVHSLYARVYGTWRPLSAHDTRVRSGPFRGARTTQAEAAFAVAVHSDLRRAARQGQSLTVFDNFATGYLSTRLQPRTFTHWIVWCMSRSVDKQLMASTFGDPARLPDIVLKVGMSKTAQKLWKRYERKRYHEIIAREDLGYVILQRGAPVVDRHHKRRRRVRERRNDVAVAAPTGREARR